MLLPEKALTVAWLAVVWLRTEDLDSCHILMPTCTLTMPANLQPTMKKHEPQQSYESAHVNHQNQHFECNAIESSTGSGVAAHTA